MVVCLFSLTFSTMDSNFVQKVEGVKSEDIICRLCVFQVLTDTALLDGTNVFLVDIKVHVCNE